METQCCNYYHLLSDFSSKVQSILILFDYKNVKMRNIPNVVSIIGILDELKVSWDDSTCELIHKCD